MKRAEEIDKVLIAIEHLTEEEKDAVLQRQVQRKYRQSLEERIGLEKKKKIGRPSRMQPEVIERLLLALRQGASISMACSFAGISHDLFRIWSQKARTYQDTLKKVIQREIDEEANGLTSSGLTPYEKRILESPTKEETDCVELFVLVDQAIAECGVRDLNSISKAAANGAWTAAAFRLSKRFPEDYGSQPEQTNVNVNVGFNYVEINKSSAKEVIDAKTIRDDEQRSIRAAELGIIEAESVES